MERKLQIFTPMAIKLTPPVTLTKTLLTLWYETLLDTNTICVYQTQRPIQHKLDAFEYLVKLLM